MDKDYPLLWRGNNFSSPITGLTIERERFFPSIYLMGERQEHLAILHKKPPQKGVFGAMLNILFYQKNASPKSFLSFGVCPLENFYSKVPNKRGFPFMTYIHLFETIDTIIFLLMYHITQSRNVFFQLFWQPNVIISQVFSSQFW